MTLTRKTPLKRTPFKRKAPTMGETKKTSRRKVTPQKRADVAFSLYIRTLRGRCQDDRQGHVCRGRLECAHGFGRGHLRTRYDERQVWCLCQGAHFFYSLNPLLWDEFMRRRMGDEVYAEVRRLALTAAPVRLDYAEIAAAYREKLRQLGATDEAAA